MPTTQDLARLLAAKTAIPADTAAPEARAGVALLLGRAGAAVSARTPRPGPTLDSLLALDALAGHSQAGAWWLALRALALRAGDTVGIHPDQAQDPVLVALIAATGLAVALDAQDEVHGALLSTWSGPMPAQGRCAHLDTTGLHLSHRTLPLATLDIHSDPRGALARIDALVGATAPTGPQPVIYEGSDAPAPTLGTGLFAPYALGRITIPTAKPHPTPLVESAALASVLAPLPSYQPVLLASVLDQGVLSDAQVETVIYAGEAHSRFLAAHPNDPNLPAPRQGFLMGHGTGFGKNRTIAAVMADNWAQGRRRHVWVSESAALLAHARADWALLGGQAQDVWDASTLPAHQPLPSAPGIVFISYDALRTETGMGRIAQLVEWMHAEDGVIAFDESQNLRNTLTSLKSDGWTQQASAQAAAARDLQDRLPRARVLYASAVSASGILSLAYAHRLGLWGEGTAFATAEAFFGAMEEGGTNALEMIARDMKAMGLYLAANMSLHGVVMERLEHRLSAAERARHDHMSRLWLDVAKGLKRAMLSTGIQTGPAAAIRREHRRPEILFNQARDRFFQATDAAMKAPLVIRAIRADLAAGHAPVVQIANTFQANAERAIAAATRDGEGIDSVTATPRDILMRYLTEAFPVYLWEQQRTKSGGIVIAPKLDAYGVQMACPTALTQRDALIDQVQDLPLPEGPLEQILDAFGPDMVAEATGRRRRLLTGADGRVIEERSRADVLRDIAAFQGDHKRILVFSDAYCAGHTYSAQRQAGNRRLRRHYLLELGARSDTTLQGMGRTHRTDQAQAPEYILVSLDLWSDRRRVSRVARGMRDLGAITRGLRQAASQEFFTQEDNLEDEYGQHAWARFLTKLHSGQVPNLSLGQFEQEANLTLRLEDGQLPPPSRLPPVQRFLNAMAAMTCASQANFGQALRAELADLRAQAVASGAYDRGIETIRPDALIKLEDLSIHRDARTGSQTRLLKMLRVDHISPLTFTAARMDAMMAGSAIVARSPVTGRVAIVCLPKAAQPQASDRVRIYTPTGMRTRTRAEALAEGWAQMDTPQAMALWEAEAQERGQEEERTFWVVSGTLLPIWDKLPKGRATVYRMETDDGEQVIGRIVPDHYVEQLRDRMAALATGGLTPEAVSDLLAKGAMVGLANGWTLQARRVGGAVQGLALYLPRKEEGAMRRLRAQGFTALRTSARHEATYALPAPQMAHGLAALLAQAPAAHVVAL